MVSLSTPLWVFWLWMVEVNFCEVLSDFNGFGWAADTALGSWHYMASVNFCEVLVAYNGFGDLQYL